jgi:hypothetical protein
MMCGDGGGAQWVVDVVMRGRGCGLGELGFLCREEPWHVAASFGAEMREGC